MTGSVLWKANSASSDWSDRAVLLRVVERVVALGMIGDVSWIRPDPDVARQPFALAAGPDLPGRLSSAIGGGPVQFEAGGSAPGPWELFWNTGEFDASNDSLRGINTLWLLFDRSQIAERARADALLAAFLELNRPDDTDYAVIHSYDHWADFADVHYERPITIASLFRGVFGANFLGPHQLAEFDRSRLAGLTAPMIRWLDARGLAFTATTDLTTADGPATEAEMLRLTAFFRGALRDDSICRR